MILLITYLKEYSKILPQVFEGKNRAGVLALLFTE